MRKVLFDVDKKSTFNLSSVPFQFLYCSQVLFDTEETPYRILTSQASTGLDTIWTDRNIGKLDSVFEEWNINSHARVVSVDVKHNYAYKIHLEFNSQHLLLIAGEIYEQIDKSLNYKIQDEMIMAFKDVENAKIFEQLAECG